MKKLLTRAALLFLAAVGVYALMSAVADVKGVASAIAEFPYASFVLACLLAFGNYGVRYLRWETYLRAVGARVPPGPSFAAFMAGLVMAVSPAKVGELLKAYLLKSCCGVSAARTSGVVVAERLTDLVAVLVLALGGIGFVPGAWPVLLAGGLIVAALLVVLAWRSLAMRLLHWMERFGRLARLTSRAEVMYVSMQELVRPRRLLWGVGLGVVAWLFEAVGFYVVLRALPAGQPSLHAAVFIYSFSTVAGALSFLPGGLGVTEGGLVALTLLLVPKMSKADAVAGSLLIRLATLWLAVVVGLVANFVFARLYGAYRPQSGPAARPRSKRAAAIAQTQVDSPHPRLDGPGS